ncbi:hypothetical protein [Indiicoccus explosivorum]|uniref:hypothetical protein n=1 Tax=Indiicoccus explosivorum TaxID=1917864 RepID=UPI000B437F84|nr:hypothetical protein [Indiicoccus explosivorum]
MVFLKDILARDVAVFASSDRACINRLEQKLQERNFRCYTDTRCYPVCVVKCPAREAGVVKDWLCETGFTCDKEMGNGKP